MEYDILSSLLRSNAFFHFTVVNHHVAPRLVLLKPKRGFSKERLYPLLLKPVHNGTKQVAIWLNFALPV